MGEAFIAQADNPTTIAFNPAGMTQLKGTQVSLEGIVTKGWIEHTYSGGDQEHSKNSWDMIPATYVTTDLGLKDLVFGIGITAPNGLSSRWSQTGFARYEDTFSSLKVIDINPSVAFQLNEHLSVGAGISYYYSDVTLENMVDYGILVGLPGQMDGKSELKGSGHAWGYNVGFLFGLGRHSFASTFKSPYKINYDGDDKLTAIPNFMGLGPDLQTDAKTSIKYPAVIVAGYAFRPVEALKLEFDLDWTMWETLNSVTVELENPSLNDVTYNYDYQNTFAYKFGLEYSVDEELDLRAGYVYNENATPENTWRPSLPDTDSHFICAGFGYKKGNFTADTAVQLILYEERTIDNNVDENETRTSSSVDGEYANIAVGFSLGITYKF